MPMLIERPRRRMSSVEATPSRGTSSPELRSLRAATTATGLRSAAGGAAAAAPRRCARASDGEDNSEGGDTTGDTGPDIEQISSAAPAGLGVGQVASAASGECASARAAYERDGDHPKRAATAGSMSSRLVLSSASKSSARVSVSR